MQTPENRFAAAGRLKLGRPEASDIESVRQAIRKQEFETAFAWNSEGMLVAARDGEKGWVTLLQEEWKAVVGGIVLHCHPDGSGFSWIDLDKARKYRLTRLEVVTSIDTYILTGSTDVWNRIDPAVWREKLSLLSRIQDRMVRNEKAIAVPRIQNNCSI